MRQRIVIIEDERDIVELVRYNFRKEGFEIESFFRGREGLDYLRRNPADLVLLDILLPDEDGFEICKRMRADEQTTLADVSAGSVPASQPPEPPDANVPCPPPERGPWLVASRYSIPSATATLAHHVPAGSVRAARLRVRVKPCRGKSTGATVAGVALDSGWPEKGSVRGETRSPTRAQDAVSALQWIGTNSEPGR